MSVGFWLPYQRSDAVFAAFSILEALTDAGVDVSILPTQRDTPRLHPWWDKLAAKTKNVQPKAWLKSLSSVVFFQVPDEETLDILHHNNISSWLIASPSAWRPNLRDAIAKMKNVVFTTEQAFRNGQRLPWLSGVKLHNLPWALCVPPLVTSAAEEDDWLGICWYIDGDQPFYQSHSVVDTVSGLVQQFPKVRFTVLLAKDIDTLAKELFEELQATAGERVELVWDLPWAKQVPLIASHDLLFWPAETDDFCLPGLLAEAAAIPVVTYDCGSPASFVQDGKTGRLIPCNLVDSAFGFPAAEPNERGIGEILSELIKNTDSSRKMREQIDTTKRSRRVANFRELCLTLWS